MNTKNLRDEMKASMQGVGVDAMIQPTTNEVPTTTNEVANEVQPTANKPTQGKKINGDMKITSINLNIKLHQFLKKLAIEKGCSLQEIINDTLIKMARRNGYEG